MVKRASKGAIYFNTLLGVDPNEIARLLVDKKITFLDKVCTIDVMNVNAVKIFIVFDFFRLMEMWRTKLDQVSPSS